MKHEVLHGLKLLLTHAHHLALIWICHVMKCCGHVANRLAQRGTLGSDLCPLCKRTVLFVVLAKCVCVWTECAKLSSQYARAEAIADETVKSHVRVHLTLTLVTM